MNFQMCCEFFLNAHYLYFSNRFIIRIRLKCLLSYLIETNQFGVKAPEDRVANENTEFAGFSNVHKH